MALFTLTDIQYKNESFPSMTPRGELTGSNVLKYPIDLGNTDKAHYMMIHVNVQEKTSYSYDYSTTATPQIQRNRASLQAQTGAQNIGGLSSSENYQNVLDTLQNVAKKASETEVGEQASELAKKAQEKFSSGVSSIISAIPEQYRSAVKEGVSSAYAGAKQSLGTLNNQNFLRTIKRTTDSIALYMPGTLQFTHDQQYNGLKMGGENAAFYGAGLSVINDALGNGKVDLQKLGKNLTPFMAERLANSRLSSVIGENSAAGIFASVIGAVQNPQLELIYSSPQFRTFRFEFMFYPTSEKEAQEVHKIVERLKFHQAPEIMTGTAGYFLVPPSEFDIEFYYNGQINPNLPKISTCVLTNIDMDYAPSGWRAYEAAGESIPEIGRTGTPFAIRLSLQFQETEIMTKKNFQLYESWRR